MRKSLFIILFLLSFLFYACSTIGHKVNFKELEANKHKTFKLGIVKVVGCTRDFFKITDDLERKKIALENIPIDKISNILTNNYGLKIDSDIDKTINIACEHIEHGFKDSKWSTPPKPGLTISFGCCDNPYWENKDYNNIVDITYGTSQSSQGIMLNRQLEYEISVRTNGKVLIWYRGEIATFGGQGKYIWDNIISYADKIDEALLRNINKTK